MYNLMPAEHLDLLGYCVIEDAIPAEQADQMADTCRGLHHTLRGQPELQSSGMLQSSGGYETLFGLMNYSDQVWTCVTHPEVLNVVHHFLGPEAQCEECCSKLVMPGAPSGGVHTDSAQDFQVIPEVPWLINSMWMLTDFTAENGATVVAPFSHRSRQKRPPKGIQASDKHMMPVTGRRGSVFLWHGALWHASGANTTSDQTRVGLNIAYLPIWWNPLRDEEHQMIKKNVYEKMPAQLQDMMRARHEH